MPLPTVRSTPPPAIGGAVVVKRGMAIKADLIDWRPTVAHDAPRCDEGTTFFSTERGGPAPSGNDMMSYLTYSGMPDLEIHVGDVTDPKPEPQQPPTRNSKGLPCSTNQMIASTIGWYPALQYPTPADIGLSACIYLAWNIKMVFRNYDIRHCFHNMALCPERAAQSLIIEDKLAPTMEDGARASNIADYGYADAADLSGRCTDPLPMILDRELNEHITSEITRELTPEERAFRHARGKLFNLDSNQCFLSSSVIYVDDLGNLHPEGYTEQADTTVLSIGARFGFEWKIDKNGDMSFIGYEFKIDNFDDSGMRIKKDKSDAYATRCESLATRKATVLEVLEQRIGELGHAAQAELDIKPLMGPFYACQFINAEALRYDNLDLRPVTTSLISAISEIVPILKASKGLPLFCDIRRPWHYDFSTLTQRTDASLPSLTETETYNGFGGWFLSQNADGTMTVHAFYGEWTAEEKVKFGGCIAAAEGVTVTFGSILTVSHKIMQKHHKDLLQLTDSLVAETKFNKLSYGNEMIERARLKWQYWSDIIDFASLDFIPREWNVGGDLLSKGQWDAFVTVCAEAGLPVPIRIYLTPEQRDVSYLWT